MPVAPHIRRASAGRRSAAAGDAAGLVAGQAPEPVVAEGELEEAVGLRSADVRTQRGRDELDDGDPPSGRDDDRTERGEQVPEPLLPGRPVRPRGRRPASTGRMRNACSCLVRKPNPTATPAQTTQRSLPGLDAAEREVGRRREQEHEQCIRVVEPEHQGRDRGDREHAARQQGRLRREVASHDAVHDGDRRDAHQRFRNQDAPRAETEEPDRERHDPQARRRLVDGDRVGRVRLEP